MRFGRRWRSWKSRWWSFTRNGGRSWLSTWSPGRSNVIQLDLLAVISPAQFREFFLHELEAQMEALDNTIYHLDGPDAIPHVPILHELFGHTPDRSSDRSRESVIPIQWVPGAGAPRICGVRRARWSHCCGGFRRGGFS